MKTIARIGLLMGLLLTFAVSQINLAAQISACNNNGPTNGGYTGFTCNLYPSTSSYTIDLTPNLTDGGTIDDYPNLLGPGYAVVINGDPNALSDNSSGLWNQSLWTAVLYWPADADANQASDELTVYYAGNPGFPSATAVQTYDEDLYGAGIGTDPEFFTQSGNPAVYAAGPNVYNVYPVPESSSMLFLGICLLVLGAAFILKVKASSPKLSA
jgi:hypothetical protein